MVARTAVSVVSSPALVTARPAVFPHAHRVLRRARRQRGTQFPYGFPSSNDHGGPNEREIVSKTAHAVLATLLSVAVVTATPTAAMAMPRHCLAQSPRTARDYRSIADTRVSSFGVGDITSMTRLPDGRVFFALGDTGYYDLNRDGSAGPLTGFGNNSAWVQSGNCFTLLDRAGPGARSWVLPPQQDGSIYWPGASVVVGSRLYVFMQRLFLNSTFGTSVGAAVAAFDLPSLKLARITTMPWSAKRVFGGGAVYDGGYVYTYASQSLTCSFCFSADMYVARVPEAQIMVPSAWRFRSGTNWVRDFHAATPVLHAAVSNTDVQHYGNGFLMVTKTISIIGPPVEAWWSPNPEGPWQDLGTVYSVPTPPGSFVPGFTYQHAYTYNPVVLTDTRLADGGMLASYNVNTFDPAEARRDGRMTGPRVVSISIPPPPGAPKRARSTPGASPWRPTFGVDTNGRVRTVDGGVAFDGAFTQHAVGVARTPTALGGWVASADGGVFAYGDATFYGSMGAVRLNQPIVGIAATPTGRGYWLVARDGGIFSFGDAQFYGSTGAITLNRPIVAMAASPTGRGYWFVASDGGIFSFGDAHFFGSTGGAPPFLPVTGMAATPDGRGYWLVTSAGQVFAFGVANDAGDAPLPLAAFAVGIVAAPGGYRIVDAAGHVFVRADTRSTSQIASPTPLVPPAETTRAVMAVAGCAGGGGLRG
jgi:hypothetical protein